jgi:hypothetical protein
MAVLALSTGDAILVIVFATIPVAALTFILGAGNALDQVGKGQFAVEFESDLGQKAPDESAEVDARHREAEIRQLLEAKAYRQSARGDAPLDVEREPAGDLAHDQDLRTEVCQLVIARNERRARRGEEPLDVDAEVERQLRDLENLGQ